jgi:hypothetical protein
MPYEVTKDGDEYVVRKKDGGKVIGRHKRISDANAQMRALYAGEMRSRRGAGKSHDLTDLDEAAELLVYQGDAVKANGTDGQILGYLVRWGSPDQPDATKTKDYFTDETDLGRFVAGELEGYYHHALPIKANPIGDSVIGSGTVKADAEGLLLAATLDLSVKGLGDVWDALKADDTAYGLSSGAVSHLVRYEEQSNGTRFIKRWPIVEWSVLEARAAGEPRTAAVAMKALIDGIKGEYLGADAAGAVALSAVGQLADLVRWRVSEALRDTEKTRDEKLAFCDGCLDEQAALAKQLLRATLDADDAQVAVKSILDRFGKGPDPAEVAIALTRAESLLSRLAKVI